jgi:diaphanous 1
MTIPRLPSRFEAMVFRRRFRHQIAEVMPDLGIMRSAALETRHSAKFKVVLQIEWEYL